ncbi:hypothetical protein L1887_17635 [Cichorium endivia]|nr:hypothetical protein L1887_17635 [Cichorium endivia]
MKTSSARDTMFLNQTLKPGQGDTLVSKSEIFELGLFTLGGSKFWHLGIWYKQVSVQTIVWVANREFPLVDPTGVLKLGYEGNLELLSATNVSIWSSPSQYYFYGNPVAQLLDSGNLVIRDYITGDIIWQSFDYPGDTWLPGMKIGVDLLIDGINRNVTSWKSSDDPSSGSFTISLETTGYPQLYRTYESMVLQRVGFWNGLGFTPVISSLNMFYFVWNDDEIYCDYTVLNSSYVTRMTLGHDGNFLLYLWNPTEQIWNWTHTGLYKDYCDTYGICGLYGSCNINKTPVCKCLEGFEPEVPSEWYEENWSNGCWPEISATNENGHYFRKFSNLKLPDAKDAWFDSSMSLQECENDCNSSVSCTAYAHIDIRGNGSRCLLWSSDLIDIRDAREGDVSGQDIYIKMYNPKLIPLANKDRKQDSELPLFSLSKIIKATSNLSIDNKLGQGGFGAVYKSNMYIVINDE